jgi:hypothetical protein
MPLYEVLLERDGTAEIRLTDRALAVGDLLEIAETAWRVARTTEPGAAQAELRYVLVAEDKVPAP